MRYLTAIVSPRLHSWSRSCGRLGAALVLLGSGATAARSKMPPPMNPPLEPDEREVVAHEGKDPLFLRRLVPGLPAGARTGSSIAFLPGDTQFVVADMDNHLLAVVDVATGHIQRTIGVNRRPDRMVVAGHLIYVTSRGGRSVSMVDTRAGTVLRTAEAGVEPGAIALTADGQTLLVVASASSEVIAFDAKTLSQRWRAPVGAIANVDDRTRFPDAIAIEPKGKKAFVSFMQGGRVDVVDLERQKVTGQLQLPKNASGTPMARLSGGGEERVSNAAAALTVSPSGKRLFVAHTMVNTGAASAMVMAGGYGLGARAPILVTIATFDLETGKLLRDDLRSAAEDDRPVSPVGRDRAHQFHRHLAFQEDAEVRELAQPAAIVHDPVHARLFLVARGTDKVVAFDSAVEDPIGRPMASFDVGEAPRGIAFNSAGTVAVVHNAHGYTASVIDLTATNLTAGPAFDIAEARHVVVGKSTLPEEVALGRRLFTSAKDTRISGGNGFACASCHPDGRHDGLVWQVGVGPRQTPILADRLSGTGPYNWLGTEEALVENIHKTIVRLGGSKIEPKEEAALARYVEQYLPPIDSPHRDQAVTTAAQVARGRELFHSADVGCSSCHDSGRGFLDGARHEIGTTSVREVELWKNVTGAKVAPGGPPQEVVPQQQIQRGDIRFQNVDIDILPAVERPAEAPVAYDTPGLRHLWASAPYLHDGSVATLEALLTTGNPGDRMGKTSHLGPADVAALAAYLRTL